MGPRATHYFVGEMLSACERALRPACDQDYPDILVHYACSNPDRTQALFDGDPADLRQILMDQLQHLAGRGCETIVVPCFSAHAVLDPIPERLPVLDLRRTTFDSLREAGNPGTVGLLGTRATNRAIRGGAWRGLARTAVRVLQDRDEERLMSLIYGTLKTAVVSDATVDGLLSLGEVLRRAGATHVIAGCTEIEMCLAASGRCPPYVVCPLRVAAERVIAQEVVGDAV
jgi:aspartate racemase